MEKSRDRCLDLEYWRLNELFLAFPSYYDSNWSEYHRVGGGAAAGLAGAERGSA